MMPRMARESSIQASIMVALSARGCVPLRVNAGVLLVGDRAVKTAPPGFSDLLVLCPGGRCVFMEVKAGKGKQRESQVKFQAMVEGMGGTYVVVRSVAEALSSIHR